MASTDLIGGLVAPRHPSDHVYNLALRPVLGGPSPPPSPAPRRFACQPATVWVTAIAIAFLIGAPTVAWILAVPLLFTGAIVGTTNSCMPSFTWGLLHREPASSRTAGSSI